MRRGERVAGNLRVSSRVVAVACCAALAACGSSGGSEDVVLTPAEQELWESAPSDRSRVPVLLYRRVDPEQFARQMALLDHAGYETVTLAEFVRFIKGRRVTLPPHPLLLTFDGARSDSWARSDGVLEELGWSAVVFVDVGATEEERPGYLSYDELSKIQAGGRWEVQLQSGTGNHEIQYGPGPDDKGPFYAYRGAEEILGGWRERVFSDVTYGEEQLAFQVEGYRPLAFAPPYGNYGQIGTNDKRIPRQLLARLFLSFDVVFTQDRSGFATPRGGKTVQGRIEITPQLSGDELHARLTAGR